MAEPPNPGRQCGSRKKARGRQALQTEMRGLQECGDSSGVKKGLGKSGIGECALDLAGGDVTGV